MSEPWEKLVEPLKAALIEKLGDAVEVGGDLAAWAGPFAGDMAKKTYLLQVATTDEERDRHETTLRAMKGTMLEKLTQHQLSIKSGMQKFIEGAVDMAITAAINLGKAKLLALLPVGL